MSNEFTPEEKESFYKTVFLRRDVRSRFKKDKIKDATIAKILNAAHHAPSVGFSQPWNFIVIKDSNTRKKIKESFDAERRRSAQLVEEESKKSKYLSLKLEGILESDINICVTYDPSRFGPFVIGRSSIPETGIYSVCCAIQNLWLAARAEGLGLGWVSILDNQILKDTLDIPQHVTAVAYLCLGFVEEFSEKPDLEKAGWLPRLKLSDVVNFEKWNRTEDSEWSSLYNMIKSNTE